MSWSIRFLKVFRSRALDEDLSEEQRFHIEARTEDLVRDGMSREAAREEANLHFGNRLRLRETSREIKLLSWADSVLQDIRFGLRILRKNAGVTLAAVLSLALAIGACTAAFSLIEALVLRPLNVQDPDRLIYLAYPPDSSDPLQGQEHDSFSYVLFQLLRAAGRPKADLAGISYQIVRPAIFNGSTGPEERIRPQWISGNTFRILGIRPVLGRLLTSADDQEPGKHPVAVISYDFWKRRFSGDPSVLGRWFTLAEKQFQIVGVAQRGFSGVEPGIGTDLWVPLAMGDAQSFSRPDWNWFRVMGRLNPGAKPGDLRAVLEGVFKNFHREVAAQWFAADEPKEHVRRFIDTPLFVRSAASGPSGLRRDFEHPLWILAAVVGLVLLIACSNVANLLIARIAAREHEMALRLSIGAGRKRLIQQLLIESGLIAAASCALGGALGVWIAPMILTLLSSLDNPVYLDLHADGAVFAFLVLTCTLTTATFGLAPAIRASTTSPNEALKTATVKSSNRIGLLRPLVAAQVGFSFIVLFVAGLLLISFDKLNHVDLGFAKEGVILFGIDAKDLRQQDEKARVLWLQLVGRVRELSGIQAAGTSGWALFAGGGWDNAIRVPGRKPDAFQPYYLEISPGFLETMRIPLLGGRDFDSQDSQPATPSSVLVNQAFARRYFPRTNAVGERFFRASDNNTWIPQMIVGVTGDTKYNDLRQTAPPTVYLPMRGGGGGTLEVRTALDPGAVTAMLNKEIPRIHPGFRISDVNLQSALISNTLIRERLLALLSGFFAVIAIILAALGIYAILNYLVVQRTKEIGIRVALGAERLRLVVMVVSNIALLLVLGLGAGLGVGMGVARFLASLL
ncbi:MAG: ABC transporter permease [Bryobacteraceae bacterium]